MESITLIKIKEKDQTFCSHLGQPFLFEQRTRNILCVHAVKALSTPMQERQGSVFGTRKLKFYLLIK